MALVDLPENLGDVALRRRLAHVLRVDPPAGAVVWRELELEAAIAAAHEAIDRLRESLELDQRNLDQLKNKFGELESAGIDVSRVRAYVRDGVGEEAVAGSSRIGLAESPADRATGRRRSRRDRRQFQIQLTDLLRAGVIAGGDEMVALYKGDRYTARLQGDGSLHVDGKGPAPSLSWAGRLITPNHINGWEFWHVERDGELISLAQVRSDFSSETPD